MELNLLELAYGLSKFTFTYVLIALALSKASETFQKNSGYRIRHEYLSRGKYVAYLLAAIPLSLWFDEPNRSLMAQILQSNLAYGTTMLLLFTALLYWVGKKERLI